MLSLLAAGAALAFAHGFAVAFDQIVPEKGRPCFLAAPKSQGDMLVEAHERGAGVPGLLAVTDDSPPETWDLAAAYAKAVGCLAGGGFVTTFRAECVSDQFGEQAILCGGVIELLKAAFDILVEKGYGPENAYFECVHELKLITDLLARHGVDGMRERISGTAAYGGLTRGPRIVDESVRNRAPGGGVASASASRPASAWTSVCEIGSFFRRCQRWTVKGLKETTEHVA